MTTGCEPRFRHSALFARELRLHDAIGSRESARGERRCGGAALPRPARSARGACVKNPDAGHPARALVLRRLRKRALQRAPRPQPEGAAPAEGAAPTRCRRCRVGGVGAVPPPPLREHACPAVTIWRLCRKGVSSMARRPGSSRRPACCPSSTARRRSMCARKISERRSSASPALRRQPTYRLAHCKAAASKRPRPLSLQRSPRTPRLCGDCPHTASRTTVARPRLPCAAAVCSMRTESCPDDRACAHDHPNRTNRARRRRAC